MYVTDLFYSKTLVRTLLILITLLGAGGCTLSASLEESLSGINSEIIPPVVLNKKNFFTAPADDSIQEYFVHGDIHGAKTFGSKMFVYGAIQGIGGYVADAAKYSTVTNEVADTPINGEFLGKVGTKVFIGLGDEDLGTYVISSYDLQTGAKADLAQLDGPVHKAKIYKGQIYLLGGFSTVNGSARSKFAIVNAETGVLSSTNISLVYTTPYYSIGDLDISDDYIAIAADLVSVNGTNIVGKVALIKQQDGTVSSPNIAGFKNSVYEFRLAFYNNSLFVSALNTSNYPRLIKLDLTTVTSVNVEAAKLTISANSYGEIQHLLVNGNQLIAVGRFSMLGTDPVTGVFSVDADTLVIQDQLNLNKDSLQNTTLYDDGTSLIYAPKPYSNGRMIDIYRLNKADLSVENTYSITDGSPFRDVYAVFSEGDDLYLQGRFLLAREMTEKFGMFGYDLESGKVLDWQAPEIQADWISAWAIDGDWVYMAGEINEVNGLETNGLVAFSLRSGEVKNLDISVSSDLIETMAVLDNELYISGSDMQPIKLNLETGEEQEFEIDGRQLYANKDHLIARGSVWLPDEGVNTDLAVFNKSGEVVMAVDSGLSIWGEEAFLADENTFYTFDGDDWWKFDLSTGAHTEVEYDRGQFGFALTSYQGKLLGFRGSTVSSLSVFNAQGQVERTLNLQTLGHLAF
ncbi:hypothetical protein EZJ49_08195 [Bdellovibrio bacteriovorus]|uniref:hypothetical protein n=1 Tax=Bdellovibrio bacteriovorus TaxID=959 RepID=UPI0021D17305|nr:hypothetical protein [Bdellovibrio bacteriovorus]UXR66228.1 hypothetical protein EZJ49_08195 [Bdellovibrio bacteriovorus]